MTSTEQTILGLLNNPKLMPQNDIIDRYEVATHNDIDLVVIKVHLNVIIGCVGDCAEKKLHDLNFNPHIMIREFRTKILQPLGLLKHISFGVFVIYDSEDKRIFEQSFISQVKPK